LLNWLKDGASAAAKQQSLSKRRRLRRMPLNVAGKIEALDRMIWSKETWLSGHGEKRPAHEVEIQRANLEMLQDIRRDYQKSLDRAKAESEAAA
jgi:hypothetical protein